MLTPPIGDVLRAVPRATPTLGLGGVVKFPSWGGARPTITLTAWWLKRYFAGIVALLGSGTFGSSRLLRY